MTSLEIKVPIYCDACADPPVHFNDEEKAAKYIIGIDKDGGQLVFLYTVYNLYFNKSLTQRNEADWMLNSSV